MRVVEHVCCNIFVSTLIVSHFSLCYHSISRSRSIATDSIFINNTNLEGLENMVKFENRSRSRTEPLSVLDLFSGIGSGSVVLKKLRIPLKKVVHVENDPVAVKVCQFNHQKDGIEHVYIDTFEEIYGENDEGDKKQIASLINDHGPFDLVLSAAPSEHYLRKAGNTIKIINAIQEEKEKHKYDEVLFLSENDVFRDSDDPEANHGLGPIWLNASEFSPCYRNRLYWTNVSMITVLLFAR